MEAMAFSHWLSEKKERYQATVQGGSLLTQMHRYFAAFGTERGNKWEKKAISATDGFPFTQRMTQEVWKEEGFSPSLRRTAGPFAVAVLPPCV